MTLDTLRLFPNQSTELRPDECAGETVADIMGNMYGIQMDAGFAYAVARTLAQSPSTIGGVDLYNTMVGAVIYGSLPYEIPRGELVEEVLSSWTSDEITKARHYHAQSVVFIQSYQDVQNCITNNIPVALSLRWGNDCNTPNADGTFNVNATSVFSGSHAVAVYDCTDKGLAIKTWQGDIGYLYITEEQFNILFENGYYFAQDNRIPFLTSYLTQNPQHITLLPQVVSMLLSPQAPLAGIQPTVTLNTLSNNQSNMPQIQSKLDTFCEAIRDFEGSPGDLNYENNNPGNCRCSPVGYLAKYGNVLCVNTASGEFAKFPTYELGWEYLENLVHYRALSNPTWTFIDFFNEYAPSNDNNNPHEYAQYVATRCGVSASSLLKDYFA